MVNCPYWTAVLEIDLKKDNLMESPASLSEIYGAAIIEDVSLK
jgi:hypothetical protein